MNIVKRDHFRPQQQQQQQNRTEARENQVQHHSEKKVDQKNAREESLRVCW
jgi:hypothetical protein